MSTANIFTTNQLQNETLIVVANCLVDFQCLISSRTLSHDLKHRNSRTNSSICQRKTEVVTHLALDDAFISSQRTSLDGPVT